MRSEEGPRAPRSKAVTRLAPQRDWGVRHRPRIAQAVLLITGVLLAGTLVQTPTPPAATAATTRPFFVLRDSFDGEGGAHRYVMPNHIDLRSADATVALQGLIWSDWGTQEATAVGTVAVCAGSTCSSGTTHVRASGLVYDAGQPRYTEVSADNVYGPDPTALPVLTSEVIVDLTDTPQIRPSKILVVGDGSALASPVTWRTWGGAVSSGRGRFLFATCRGACNTPKLRPIHRVSATFVADRLEPCLTGTFWRYTRLVVGYRYHGRARRQAFALTGCPD